MDYQPPLQDAPDGAGGGGAPCLGGDRRPAAASAVPFTVAEPDAHAAPAPVLFASPHSGNHYPGRFLAQLRVPLADLRRVEDAFVDRLFADVPLYGAALLKARYGRSFVDLNRDARALDPAMFQGEAPPRDPLPAGRQVAAGLGTLPRVGSRGADIYAAPLDPSEAELRLSRIHDRWHSEVAARLDALCRRAGTAVLIDCHSMPSSQRGKAPAAVVLGDRFGTSCGGWLTDAAERSARRLGLSVARNDPYAGGYTTRRHGKPARGIHALQIELRRDLYMHEAAVTPTKRFGDTQRKIAELAADLIEASRQHAASL